mmetsp:Transcript_2839/g.7486  ORF Transcript_2839/g.7486 Transcript_2839/m.7486 type:complete len:93 (-) Transcript_2839:1130-1408(-)
MGLVWVSIFHVCVYLDKCSILRCVRYMRLLGMHTAAFASGHAFRVDGRFTSKEGQSLGERSQIRKEKRQERRKRPLKELGVHMELRRFTWVM